MTPNQSFSHLPRRDRRRLYNRAIFLAARDWQVWLAYLPLIFAFVLAVSVPHAWLRFLMFFVAVLFGILIWMWRANRHLRELL